MFRRSRACGAWQFPSSFAVLFVMEFDRSPPRAASRCILISWPFEVQPSAHPSGE